jgi:hypothetical protein
MGEVQAVGKRCVTVVIAGVASIGIVASVATLGAQGQTDAQLQTQPQAQTQPQVTAQSQSLDQGQPQGAAAPQPPLQTPPRPQSQVETQPVLQVPPQPQAQAPRQPQLQPQTQAQAQTQAEARLEEARARMQLNLMETALRQAVTTGASRLIGDFIAITQGQAEGLLLRTPQAQGFRLGGYGTFFYVLVPGMRGTAIVAYSTLRDESRRIERGRVAAQSLTPELAVAVSTARPVPSAEPPPPSPFEQNVLNDPQGSYVRSVKKELIEAMNENSGALRIPADGFLTVAARSDTPPNPLDPTDEVRTMTFQIKGADLEAYHQRRISKEEVLKLVRVTED